MKHGKKLIWTGFALGVLAMLWFVVPPVWRYAYAVWYLSSAKRFNIEEATKGGIVYIPVNSQRFAIPKEYVGGVSTSHDGSVSSIYLRFVLPELEHYDPNNPRHSDEFSAMRGGGWRNKLNFRFGDSPTAPVPRLYQIFVEWELNTENPRQRVSRRAPEADDPEGLEIYSTPNFIDATGGWRPGKDIYVLSENEKILYFARCDRVIPGDFFPGCEVNVDFADDVRGRYDFGRPHIKDWKRIHEHLTGLVHAWMQPLQPDSTIQTHPSATAK